MDICVAVGILKQINNPLLKTNLLIFNCIRQKSIFHTTKDACGRLSDAYKYTGCEYSWKQYSADCSRYENVWEGGRLFKLSRGSQKARKFLIAVVG